MNQQDHLIPKTAAYVTTVGLGIALVHLTSPLDLIRGVKNVALSQVAPTIRLPHGRTPYNAKTQPIVDTDEETVHFRHIERCARLAAATYPTLIAEGTYTPNRLLPGPRGFLRIIDAVAHYRKSSEAYRRSNRTTFCRLSGVDPADILDELYIASPFKPAYITAIHHSDESVLVTVRGSISLSDLTTDLLASPVQYKEGFIHQGFLISSQWVWDRIVDSIDEAVDMYPDYKIEFIGHSMGGSCCAILADMYRDHRPDCADRVSHFTIGSPPFITRELLDRFAEFSTVVVNRGDYVSRASAANLVCFPNKTHVKRGRRFRVKAVRETMDKPLLIGGRIILLKPAPALLDFTIFPGTRQLGRMVEVEAADLTHLHVYIPLMYWEHCPHRYMRSIRLINK
ncbi:Lipase (class 3) [Carpediemonas membranifera]|uniref:Lipase (Class 3) n=1 Tax=Carpediemonas membranifera TaxID=201153 RepID=A0A8J6B732_9EUKA|nr:Lipase (class 3) [Carpediemonas membranifera]|eukprot:KAG9397023.1 Lipase (class 3) [Carpediemonas membranifera]